jgi:hypothetical protein
MTNIIRDGQITKYWHTYYWTVIYNSCSKMKMLCATYLVTFHWMSLPNLSFAQKIVWMFFNFSAGLIDCGWCSLFVFEISYPVVVVGLVVVVDLDCLQWLNSGSGVCWGCGIKICLCFEEVNYRVVSLAA